jgi:hypothetical protein
MAASLGRLDGAPIEFEAVNDVPDGGVLLGLPALLQNGLLLHSREMFSMPEGFYPLESIFLLLALMALARISSVEELRYVAPGEWGKLLGLDRIPEVRTLRRKVAALCSEQGRAERWSAALAREWMLAEPQCTGVLYVDAHVRVYHGELTDLPRRYIARQRLCLRGTTDYWVNAMDGRPFFCVTQAVDPGLVEVLREVLVPRLLEDVPWQPDEAALAADPLLSRLIIVFDRGGYSPDLFAWLKKRRIAILTYHKFPAEPWPEDEFLLQEVTLINGESVAMSLAERGTRLSNGLWVREVRRLNEGGHQTAILSTDYHTPLTQVAVRMFARWCQENFFRYMMEHFGLDRLAEHGTQSLPDTTRVVNPTWRELDSQVRRENSLLSRQARKMASLSLPADLESPKVEALERKRGELQQTIEHLRHRIEQLKLLRKAHPKHVTLKDLPEKDRFSQLKSERKHFVDTIKLVSYRAETAMAHIAREKMARLDDARSLIRQVFHTEADLIPDHNLQTLTVRLHPLSARVHDEIIRHLCNELTATETLFPGTNLRLVYELIGSS